MLYQDAQDATAGRSGHLEFLEQFILETAAAALLIHQAGQWSGVIKMYIVHLAYICVYSIWATAFYPNEIAKKLLGSFWFFSKWIC